MMLKSSKIKNPLWRSVFAPFEAVRCHKLETFIWFSFVLVAGLLGIIINVIKRFVFDGQGILVALGPDSAAGSFYTFSMVTFSSLIYPLFLRTVKSEKPKYHKIHVAYITVLIFTLLFCGVFYSFSTLNQPVVDYSKMSNEDMEVVWSQVVFFFLAIIFSAYSFGLTLVSEHENELHLSDEYLIDENRNVNQLSESSESLECEIKIPSGEHIKI